MRSKSTYYRFRMCDTITRIASLGGVFDARNTRLWQGAIRAYGGWLRIRRCFRSSAVWQDVSEGLTNDVKKLLWLLTLVDVREFLCM